jgi:dTDP-4-dehydrorhamnose reductase
MRLLVLGAGGMLGHKLWDTAARSGEAWATIRSRPRGPRGDFFDHPLVLQGVDVTRLHTMQHILDRVKPTAVVNCVGVVKQIDAGKDPITSIGVNALLPHQLARICGDRDIRLVHISTDCVFAGTKGGYRENDVADAGDLYGRTKLLGEIAGPGCLTLRTSMIGRELGSASGLVEWFLARRGGQADGYRRAVFSGFTTLELSRIILDVINRHPDLTGLYHVSAAPIDKLDLLTLLNDAFHTEVAIAPRDEPVIDRSLDSTRFREATGYRPPAWKDMVQELASDPTPYDRWREQ